MFTEIGGYNYEIQSQGIVSECYDNFPELHFMFDKLWVTVYPSDYVVDISDSQDRSLCQVKIEQGARPFAVMGVPLLMNYYTIHDDVNGQLGFTPHTDSNKSQPQWGSIPSKQLGDAQTQADFAAIKEENEINNGG